jgi:hypothetical protein
MTSQPRLHIAKITPVEASFDELFAACAETARSHLARTQFSLVALWDYAQYLDLSDAGYGKKTDSLYAMVASRARTMLRSHGQSPAVRQLCGKTCVLSNMLNEDLDSDAGDAIVANYGYNNAQAAA